MCMLEKDLKLVRHPLCPDVDGNRIFHAPTGVPFIFLREDNEGCVIVQHYYEGWDYRLDRNTFRTQWRAC